VAQHFITAGDGHLGVYSNRRHPSDGFEAKIGIVWRENIIYDD
jgi:hypothetical protein